MFYHNNERPEKSTEYLAPSYKELYQVIQLGHDIRGAHYAELTFIYAWKPFEKESERYGPENKGEPKRKTCLLGYPVNCATGNQVETQTDLTVGGRGLGLRLTRTYNSQLSAKQTEHGSFGFGWTGSYSAHLELNYQGREAIVHQDNGSTVTFTRGGSSLMGEGGEEIEFLPEVKAWVASGYKTLSGSTKALISQREAKQPTPKRPVPRQSTGALLARYEEAGDRALIKRSGALAKRAAIALRPVEHVYKRLEKTLGLSRHRSGVSQRRRVEPVMGCT
jgi:Domain of unknown function (DUF6531)